MGRKARPNTGYWYRTGRGWYTTEGRNGVPLKDESGDHLKERNTPKSELLKALLRRTKERTAAKARPGVIIADVVNRYLDSIKETSPSTWDQRGRFLFDFCTGFPGRCWRYKKAKPDDRIHRGFGDVLVCDLIKGDVFDWLKVHPKWTSGGSQRGGIQALKRALNWAVEMDIIEANPIKGYKVGKCRDRVTYFTPEQEEALLKYAKPDLRIALRCCIRTGARFGCEFAALQRRHVSIDNGVMYWVFPADEAKARSKERRIIVPKEIAEITLQQMKMHDSRWVFRNSHGKPWNRNNLSERFRCLMRKCIRKGIKFDADACMYSCRHTFAKRILNGYWTNKVQTIEHLAQLMGNTPDVCRKYAQFVDSYQQPLLDAVGA